MKREYIKPPIKEDVTQKKAYIELNQVIRDFWHCNHDEVTCLITMVDDRQTIKNVCKLCGHSGPAQSKKKFTEQQIAELHPTTTQGLLDFRKTKQGEYDKLCQLRCALVTENHSNYSTAWWAWYNEYLLSEDWKEKRQRVLHNAGGVCEACGAKPATQVHHISYKHVGNEPLWDLKAVCDECHKALHEGVENND